MYIILQFFKIIELFWAQKKSFSTIKLHFVFSKLLQEYNQQVLPWYLSSFQCKYISQRSDYFPRFPLHSQIKVSAAFVQFSALHFKRNVDILDWVQQKTTKMIRGPKHMMQRRKCWELWLSVIRKDKGRGNSYCCLKLYNRGLQQEGTRYSLEVYNEQETTDKSCNEKYYDKMLWEKHYHNSNKNWKRLLTLQPYISIS